jgi:hypothetical protein
MAHQLKGPLTRPVVSRLAGLVHKEKISTCVWQTWQRPTLPRLETKYHQRWSVSRPSSEWDRVQPLRHNHQVGKTHVVREAVSSDWPQHSIRRKAWGSVGAFRWSLSCLSSSISGAMSIRNENDQADRTISTGKLQALPLFHTRPINVVVFHGSQGILVLRWVSRLDAFSGYPVRI